MANLTVAIPDALLQAARLRAVREGTSVNEVCRRALESFAQAATPDPQARVQRLQDLWQRLRQETAQNGAAAYPTASNAREALYAQALDERHPSLMNTAARPE